MRRAKSLRIGVHHANAVVWEPVYRTHLSALAALAVSAAAAAAASTRRRRLHLPRVLVRLRVVAEVAEVAYVAASSSPAASSSSKRAVEEGVLANLLPPSRARPQPRERIRRQQPRRQIFRRLGQRLVVVFVARAPPRARVGVGVGVGCCFSREPVRERSHRAARDVLVRRVLRVVRWS